MVIEYAFHSRYKRLSTIIYIKTVFFKFNHVDIDGRRIISIPSFELFVV